MAQTATVYNFDVALSDVDRHVYETLALRVARQPSETEEYLVTRVLAYCLEYTDGIAFSKGGIADPDEPSVSVRDLTGALRAWIEIGAPDAERLHKASKASPRVAVYTHRDPATVLRALEGERIHRADSLEIHALPRQVIDALVARLDRRTSFALAVTDRHLYVTIGGETIDGLVERYSLQSGAPPAPWHAIWHRAIPGRDVPAATKLVVLARGLGTRMRAAADVPHLGDAQAAAADTGVKAMIPIDRPFLDYALSAFADAGLREICLVIGPDHHAIREHYASARPRRLFVEFAVQERPIGTADAVLSAREFAGDESFLVVNSDNYYPASVIARLRQAPAPALPAFSRDGLVRDGQIPPERIARYALLAVRADGTLERIIEKPTLEELAALGDARVSMNCWLFDSSIFEACRRVPVSARGEVELPLAVQFAIDHLDMRFHVFNVDAPVLDLSYRADIPSVTRRLEGVRVEL